MLGPRGVLLRADGGGILRITIELLALVNNRDDAFERYRRSDHKVLALNDRASGKG